MKPVGELSRKELAGLVCETLTEAGIDVVLVGGSCVSIYTNEVFASLDLDFVALGSVSNKRIANALAAIGFGPRKSNARYFEHPDTSLTLEFPPSPLMLGDEYVPESEVDEMDTSVGTLKLLRPTDCVKDRLANYYYGGDQQCYQQALMVAGKHPVDWKALERWHEIEGEAERFLDFRHDVESL